MKTYPIENLENKRILFALQCYSIPAPPVCSARWNRDDWIRYIDIEGYWHKDTNPEPTC